MLKVAEPTIATVVLKPNVTLARMLFVRDVCELVRRPCLGGGPLPSTGSGPYR